MKKSNCIISFILATLIVFNLFGNYTFAYEDNNTLNNKVEISNKDIKKHANGFIPYKVKITKESENLSPKLKSAPLPATYDLRKTGRVTSVKDQGQVNDCWAFSSIGSLESNLLRIENNTYDFSEINMATHNDVDNNTNNGGNSQMATGYLASWKGPINETDDPEPTDENNITIRNGLAEKKHVQDVIFIPDRNGSLDNSEIKQAVMEYGAVSSSLYMDEFTYLNWNTNAYYNYGNTLNNHAIDIVGWDDSYSKNNFSTVPAGDGAFLCKNSWGKYFGDNGYFYVSYYDISIGCNNAVFDGVESVNNYSKNYQYDTSYNATLTYGTNNWFANVFTANNDSKNSEVLSAISFYTDKENTSYKIYDESDYAANKFNKISSNLAASGTIAMPGYHTIKLDKPINLIAGKQFAVAVNLVGSSIPLDYNNSSNGNSFISYSGNQWSSYGKAINLKAFTNLSSKISVTGISLDNTFLNMNVRNVQKLNYTITPDNVPDKSVTWRSSNASIASVDEEGNVKAISPGTAVITVKSSDGGYTAQCTVNVKKTITVNSVSVGSQPVKLDSDVEFTFSDSIYKGSKFDSIVLKDSDGNTVPATISINNNILIIKPNNNLNNSTMYSVSIPVNSVTSAKAEVLISDYNLNFTTITPYNSDIKFSDSSIERRVRNILGKTTGNITTDDMSKLTSLDMSGSTTRSLGGLEYATNLNSLDLGGNKIVSIDPISNLLSLMNLNLNSNRITDLSPIKNLSNLNEINFSNNAIADLTPLVSLSKLGSVSLSDNSITDLNPLENLTNLNYIMLQGNEISDVEPLVNNLKNNSNSDNIFINVANNFISTDTGASDYNGSLVLANISNNYYIGSQNSGAVFSTSNKSNVPTCGPYIISFKNNIRSDVVFNEINLLDSSGKSVDIDKYILGNKLIIKPKKLLEGYSAYTLYVPQDAIIDSDNKQVSTNTLYFTTNYNSVDVNNDGKVDIKDIATTSQNYNSNFNNENWNMNYDINDDGVVDLYDLVSMEKWIQ